MRRSVMAAAWWMAAALAACGGGKDNDIIIDPQPDAPPVEQGCNPVAQTGCEAGEKCTWIYVNENPVLGRTECMPEGTQELGALCTLGGINEADDCKAGGLCIGGVCTSICSIEPDSCPVDQACNLFADVFEDQNNNVGACRPTCDPVGQNCPEGEACYLMDWDGQGTCGIVPQAAAEKVQDQTCYGPTPDTCYINGCARGFDTFQVLWNGFDNGVCMQFCSPAATGLDPVNGDQLDNLRGDINGVTCGTYDASAGELANSECRFFNALIGPRSGANTPDVLGICLTETFRTQIELGSCTTHQLGAEPTQENVDNGTYVVGCEPLSDITGAAARELPEGIRRQQELFRALVEQQGMGLMSMP